MDFSEVAYALHDIASVGSTLAKERLLRGYADEVEGFLEVIKYIYDPYFTTGIGLRKLESSPILFSDITAEYIMSYLRNNFTGTDMAAAHAASFVYSVEDPIVVWAATGLVTKDLQIGVSVTTLNKVFGAGFIPVIGIMRGMQCPDDASGTYIVTEKIDGNRRLIMTTVDGVKIYTRSGKRDVGLVQIEEEAKYLPLGFVYDCECVAVGEFADSIELRQASASILNSKGARKGVKALCFDMLPIDEYNMGRSKWAAVYRKYFIAAYFKDERGCGILSSLMTREQNEVVDRSIEPFIHAYRADTPLITGLPILGVAHNKQEGINLAKPIWETGGEGVMMVDYKSPYEVNPNPRKTLLKIKATQEYTLLCTDIEEGSNKYTGMLGAIWVWLTRRGDPMKYTFKVGSGFPDYLRVEYWQHPEKIVGKMVEIESFGESRNAQGEYALNCPIFKRVVGDV